MVMQAVSENGYLRLTNAHLIPPLSDQRWANSTGVFDANGQFRHESLTRRGYLIEGQIGRFGEKPEKKLSGRHIYGGQLNHHFGHFLCESLARLWVLGELREPVESILLMPRRRGSHRGLQAYHRALFDAFGLNIPIRVVEEPLTVEELILPEQGFGIGEDAVGTEKFRAYVREHFLPDVQPEGPERLYISREAMRLTAGAILGESQISKHLCRQGYEQFHPEKHDIRTQVARYKAAKKIVSVEGSALHLFGFVGNPSQEVAVIARRSDHFAAEAMVKQLHSFCGISAKLVDVIEREWDVREDSIRSSRSVSYISIKKLGRALRDGGFVDERPWSAPKVNIDRKIGRIAGRSGLALTEYPRNPHYATCRPASPPLATEA